MKEIVFVTSNKGKIASAQKELNELRVLPYNAELIEPRSDDIKEIARQKVLQAYQIVKRPCISMDVGFYVHQLNGFPRAYVNHMLDTIGIKGLLKLMSSEDNRTCEFSSCLAYYDGEQLAFFESKSPGLLAAEVRGSDSEWKWSDLWYIFMPQAFNRTLAEFTAADMDRYNEIREDSCLVKFGKWYR